MSGATPPQIEVECYAGYKANERPTAFVLEGTRLRVLGINDRWLDPHADYFKVRADDGHLYLLRHDRRDDSWTLVRQFHQDS